MLSRWSMPTNILTVPMLLFLRQQFGRLRLFYVVMHQCHVDGLYN